MTSLNPSLDVIYNDVHTLLEPPSLAYSNVTVRRAFIVWLYCGQKNKFQDVCNYYHYLEAMEDTLSPELRAQSRHHEFHMFTNPPPISIYQKELFPNLYSNAHVQLSHIKKLETIKNEQCVFKLEGFNELPRQNGVTAGEVIDASMIIRQYCKTQMIPLKKFLIEFKDHAKKCGLQYTVYNITTYIKRKMLESELNIVHKYPKTYDFLESTPVTYDSSEGNNKELSTLTKTDENNITMKSKKENTSPKIPKLNNNCAEFFKSFNLKHKKKSWNMNKTFSYSPLIAVDNFTCKEKKKSRSVESLLQSNTKIDLRGLENDFFSQFTNVDEVARHRRI